MRFQDDSTSTRKLHNNRNMWGHFGQSVRLLWFGESQKPKLNCSSFDFDRFTPWVSVATSVKHQCSSQWYQWQVYHMKFLVLLEVTFNLWDWNRLLISSRLKRQEKTTFRFCNVEPVSPSNMCYIVIYCLCVFKQYVFTYHTAKEESLRMKASQ